jgi:methylenetetrahydrofolate reductase (NADPH)
LAQASNPAEEGIAIASEQVATYRTIAQGVHLMAVKAEERIPEILRQAGIEPVLIPDSAGLADGQVAPEQLVHGLLLR